MVFRYPYFNTAVCLFRVYFHYIKKFYILRVVSYPVMVLVIFVIIVIF